MLDNRNSENEQLYQVKSYLFRVKLTKQKVFGKITDNSI